MSEVEFEELWKEFISREYKDSGFENIRQVQNYIRGLSDRKRAAFLDELVSVGISRKDGYGIALSVLESEAMPQHIQVMCAYVNRIINNPSEPEIDVISILRVLASDASGQCLAPVERYLLDNKIGPYWSSLPWALWPHHPELFCRAQVRYFTTRPSNEWRYSVIPQAFLTRPDALALLKSRLSEVSKGAWQELRGVLLEQRNASWLNEAQQKMLAEVLVS
jgi:hypothetical protein